MHVVLPTPDQLTPAAMPDMPKIPDPQQSIRDFNREWDKSQIKKDMADKQSKIQDTWTGTVEGIKEALSDVAENMKKNAEKYEDIPKPHKDGPYSMGH